MALSKMTRQLMLYDNICKTYYHGPEELMHRFGISRRMLQRDLKDLRDAGALCLRYDKKERNYIPAKEDPVFDESAVGRRRQHLLRLRRLTTLIDQLERTDMHALDLYMGDLEIYEFYKESMIDDPENFPPEDLGDPPEMPEMADIKASYYSLFPDSNERKRQRDFAALNEAGFEIYYSHRLGVFIFDESGEASV
ncbi:MAG: hypothetical protein IK078_01760 [Lachnospiraceae bacterium]|nr:hypothetical protein [Lachnospiraceae bacterium]